MAFQGSPATSRPISTRRFSRLRMVSWQHPFCSDVSGLALVTLIILLTFVMIAVLSVSVFVVERSRLTSAEKDWDSGIYAAKAGIHAAVYIYRVRDGSGQGYFALGQYNMNADHNFVLGGEQQGLLMVDTSNAVLQGGGQNKNLRNIDLQNVTDSQSIRIDEMNVSWNTNARLRQIRVNNRRVWRGNVSSPASLNTNNYTFAPGDVSATRFDMRFRGNMNGAVVDVEFIMQDGSGRLVRVYPASDQFNFIVRSTGRANGAGVFRTVEAEYNAVTGRIVNEQEVVAEITP